MKKRGSCRAKTLVVLAATLFYAGEGVVLADDYQKPFARSAGYAVTGTYGSMSTVVGVPSSGLSTLYVRGQSTFDDNYQEGGVQPAWESSQKETYENNSYAPSSDSLTRSGWVTPVYNVLRVRGGRVDYNAEKGSRNFGDQVFDFDNFHQTRTGFLTGMNWESADSRNTLGLVLGYGSGNMNQGFRNYLDPDPALQGFVGDNLEDGTIGQTQNHHIHIGIDDFQFGGTFVHKMDCGAVLTVGVLGGSQHYDWTRTVSLQDNVFNDGNFTTTSDVTKMGSYVARTAGNTLGVFVTMAKSFDMGYGWSWSPQFDYESAHSTIYSAGETGGSDGPTDAWNPQSLEDRLQTHRNTFRGGASIAYNDGAMDFSLKAMYGRIIEKGLGAANVSNNSGSVWADIGGYGQDSLLTGAHIGGYFNAEKTFYVGGDYQLTLYKEASNQMASMTILRRF